jgi:hypothetical protein
MKNHEIVRALPQLKTLKSDLRSVEYDLDHLVKNLTKQRDQLRREVDILSRVTEIDNSVAVNVRSDDNMYGKGYQIGAVAYEIERRAEVYPNAHTSVNGVAQDWGVKLHGPRKSYGGLEENFLGTSWAWRDAVSVARRWVTHAEVPSESVQAMAKARHRFDPKGTASKRRHEAFEAAWMAGDKQLAEQLLTERTRMRKTLTLRRVSSTAETP